MNFGPFILLHDSDNVLVCREQAAAGSTVNLNGTPVALPSDVAVGHKIARYDLKAGDKIFKYGAPIGSMKVDAPRGAHIHMHNMKSDYISSHTREATGHE